MADFSALKTSIQNYIKQNGNEEITGNLLQQILLSMVTTLGDNAINDLVTALNAEIANRGNADTELGGRITTLQGVVNGVVANVENGYVYAGIATPSSTPTSGKVFYLALTAGTYTNFGATVVPQGINILKYNGSVWSLDSFLGLDDTPTQGSNNLVKSGGVLDSIIKDGSAFDLSAYNNGATYADLSAALTALNDLPAAYKKGGMSVKFVLTSDNKYVQYRLMAESWSTTVSDWQGVDEIPTIDSENYVMSGGVYDNFDGLNKKLYSDQYNIVSTLTTTSSIPYMMLDSNGEKQWGGYDCAIHVYRVEKNKTYRVVSSMAGSNPSMCLMSDAECTNLIKVVYIGADKHISIFTAPSDCYFAYSYWNGYGEEIVNEINYTDFILDDVKNATKYVSKVSNIYVSASSTQTGKAINPDYGNIADNPSYNVIVYNVGGYSGEIRIPFDYDKGANYLGYIFKRNGVTIEYGSYLEKDTFVIPSNADEFWFTAKITVTNTDINILPKVPINEVVKKLDNSTLYNGLFVNKVDTLATGEQLLLTNVPDLHNYHLMSFYANIETMGRIRLQHGNIAYAIGAIEVDDTNVYCYNNANGTDVVKTVPHEVDIEEFIFIQVDYKNDYPNLLVRISSNGSAFKEIQINNAYWNGGNGVTFVKSILGTFTNAHVSFGGRAWFYDTWVFTDSYGDYWPKYLIGAGIDKFMLDGVSGRDSENAYASFELDLKVTTPKVVLWCLGMNDPDNGSAINQDYKTYLDKLINVCKECNIKLVVTTIPNTPTQNNMYKNEYIKSIGVDYIDVAKAVGGDTMGSSWTTGYLSTDNVHPTALGAMVIANAIVTGLPSIQ